MRLSGLQPAYHPSSLAPSDNRCASVVGRTPQRSHEHVLRGQASVSTACPLVWKLSPDLLAFKTALIKNCVPRLVLRDGCSDQRHHPGPGTAVLYYPKHFTIGSELVELRIGEVPR